MTIREVEECTGMARANIRFYESEGLIAPERKENGYRDYSEQDVEVLLRIKLLRSVRISLEEIKALRNGEEELLDALDENIARLSLELDELARSQDICRRMRRDEVRFDSLDARHYLNSMEHEEKAIWKQDTMPRVRHPFRRFLARSLDWQIYSGMVNVAVAYLFNVYIPDLGWGVELLLSLLSVGLMFLCEPLLLKFFGTTPGKWLMGLRVTDPDGEKLSFQEGAERLWSVVRYGYGYYLPIYNLYRGYKSIIACDEGALPWDEDTTMELRDTKPWRVAASLAAYALVIGVYVLLILGAELPPNRGDITVAEFAENYNQFMDYYELGSGSIFHLDESGNGRWANEVFGENVIFIGGDYSAPEFVYTVEDGVMTGMSFEVEQTNGGWNYISFDTEMFVAAMSFIRAQEGCHYFEALFRVRDTIVEAINGNKFTDFSFSIEGVTVTCDYEYEGYDIDPNYGLWPQAGQGQYFYMKFTMTKE